MNDKESFANFIVNKRKAINLTQKALAEKLNVTETAVSKWERGITYPDITLVSNICEILNITEKEFITACDDIAFREEQKRLRRIEKTIKYSELSIVAISIFTIITCFIINIIIDKKLSWSLIVLISIMIFLSLTILPMKITNYKIIKSFIITTVLIYLLFIIIKLTTNPEMNLLESLTITTVSLLPIWSIVLISTFLNNKSLKKALSLIIIGVFVIFANPIIFWIETGIFNFNNIPRFNLPIGISILIMGILSLFFKNIKLFFK